MKKGLFHRIDQWITRLIIYPGDDKEILLRKKIWLIIVACFLFFSFSDGLINLSLEAYRIVVIDIIEFSLLSAMLTIFYFHRKNIEAYGLFLQLSIVTLPSVKAFLYGGIFHASGVEIVGLIGPIYALTFPKYRRAVFMLLYYLVLIIGGTVIYEYSNILPGFFNSLSFYLGFLRFSCATGLIFFVALIYNLQIAKLKLQEEDRLKQLHAAKSKFYTNITHEFRTPLTIILGIADNIRDKITGTLDKEVQMIKHSGNKLLKLVNQLLNLSKMEAGAMPVNLVQDDILPYIKYIVESFHSIAEEKNIRIHYLSSLDAMVMDYDPDIIGEVISNLLSNAVKFTPRGGNVYVQADATIANEKVSAHSLFVNVRDTGTGIAEDKLPYIFDRFYQADDESTRKTEGTGIGLALVKEYISLLKGTIQVKSRTGKGTSFLLTLPVTQGAPLQQVDFKDSRKKFNAFPEKDEKLITAETQAPEDIQDNLPLLLIVEDNNDVVEYLLSVLNHKYQAIVAGNGNEGIYKAVESVPDIIICDVMMPEKDGYEVCSALKNDFRTNHIPIVLLTAKADIDSKIAGLEFGADAYIIKPFNKKELLVRLEKLIENRQKLKNKYGEMIYAAAKAGKPKGLNEVFLQKITEALEKNYHDENYGIFKLCLDIGISRAQLHRKLIALTGKSTSDLIRHYRMKKAKEILLTSDRSISEIAYEVGFKDPNYFTKSFTREYGMTPTQFRSENFPVKQ